MTEELCLFKGFQKEQAAAALKVISEEGGATGTRFAPMTEGMKSLKMQEILERISEGEMIEGKVLSEGRRVVFMGVESQERAVTLMRGIKSVSEDPGEIAFAMITRTALGWSLQEYVDHVCAEHEYMKTHNPADDEDMKRIE